MNLSEAIKEIGVANNLVKEEIVHIKTALSSKFINTDSVSDLHALIEKIYDIKLSTLPDWFDYNGKWLTQESMPNKKDKFAIAEVGGIVYIFGGYQSATSGAKYYKDTIRFNPLNGEYTTLAQMPLTSSGVYGHSAVSVGTKIYVMGGYNSGTKYNYNFCYDTASDTWTEKTIMPVGLYNFSMSAIGTDIYVIGGNEDGVGYTNKIHKYSTTSNSWTIMTSLPVAKDKLATIAVDNKIYIFGGFGAGASQKTVDVLDVLEDTITPNIATMPVANNSFSVCKIRNEIHLIGGDMNAKHCSLDLNTLTWKDLIEIPSKSSAANGRLFGAGSITIENLIYTFGGSDGGTNVQNQAFCYMP